MLSVPAGCGSTSGVPGGAEPAIVFGPPLPVRVSLPLPPVRPSTSAAIESFSPACPLPVDGVAPAGSVAVTADRARDAGGGDADVGDAVGVGAAA